MHGLLGEAPPAGGRGWLRAWGGAGVHWSLRGVNEDFYRVSGFCFLLVQELFVVWVSGFAVLGFFS